MHNNTIIKALIMSFLVLGQLFAATTFTFNQALKNFYKSKPELPEPQDDGRIPTLNNKGTISNKFDDLILKFLAFGQKKKVLEIGGAYGHVMLEALKLDSSTIYHLNDLDRQHLSIAAFRLQEKLERKELYVKGLENVKFIQADITKSSWYVNGKYDAVLISRVLHFLDPKELNQTVANLFKCLKPGGRVYITAITPYVKRFEKFIPEYEKRLKAGDPYPGYVKDLTQYLSNDSKITNELAFTSGPFMFLDDTVISRLFKKAGFKILECRLVPLGYHSNSWQLDGREHVIIIAEKS